VHGGVVIKIKGPLTSHLGEEIAVRYIQRRYGPAMRAGWPMTDSHDELCRCVAKDCSDRPAEAMWWKMPFPGSDTRVPMRAGSRARKAYEGVLFCLRSVSLSNARRVGG
jgi:hypothetical protein